MHGCASKAHIRTLKMTSLARTLRLEQLLRVFMLILNSTILFSHAYGSRNHHPNQGRDGTRPVVVVGRPTVRDNAGAEHPLDRREDRLSLASLTICLLCGSESLCVLLCLPRVLDPNLSLRPTER